MSEILVIGDDLTGTNATASAYARDGLRAVTMLDPTAPVDLDDSIQVVACSTGSRHQCEARPSTSTSSSEGPSCRHIPARPVGGALPRSSP